MLETLILILVVIILIIVLQLKGNLNDKLNFLNMQLDKISSQLAQKELKSQEKPTTTPVEAPDPVTVIPEEVIKTPFIPKPPAPAPPPIVQHSARQKAPVPVSEQAIVPAREEKKTAPYLTGNASAVPPIVNELPQKPEKPSFSERNPDLEKFIGENLFNKIGIVILVLGMGFFLKYAIDKDWINEIGRVCIGILCGGGLIALAHKLRKSFATFSSVLVGGGIAILYFTVTIAFHQYQLFNQTVAFLLTILITGFTVLLSINYDRKELAIFAILGGFGAPFMVSSGEGNYIVLFTYILTLNLGMLVLAYYKKWSVINIICYVFTIILFGGWLSYGVLNSKEKLVPYAGALIFATLFYLTFLVMNIINNIKEKTPFNALEIGILLSNTFLYYTAGMLILKDFGNGDFSGLFTVLLSLINLVFAYALYKNEKVDRNLIYLLIGIVLTFISLAGPVQLKGNHITLFWAAESVLLLWLSQKSGITLIRQTSIGILGLMVGSLIIDWQQVYFAHLYDTGRTTLTPVINRGFITGLVAILSISIYSRLLKAEIRSILFDQIKTSRLILTITAIVIGYLVLLLEINYQGYTHFPQTHILILACYNYLFVCILFIPVLRAELELFRMIWALITAVAISSFIMFYNTETILLRNSYLIKHTSSLSNYLLHYLLIVLLGILIYQLYIIVKKLKKDTDLVIYQVFTAFVTLFVISAELDHLLVMTQYSDSRTIYDILENSHKTWFPIVWGCFSLLCIYLGMKWKSRNIRVISIIILTITLVKLFFFDLGELSEGGKIAAFISLGVLLLVISFMYQRLKKLLLTNTTQTDDQIKSEN